MNKQSILGAVIGVIAGLFLLLGELATPPFELNAVGPGAFVASYDIPLNITAKRSTIEVYSRRGDVASYEQLVVVTNNRFEGTIPVTDGIYIIRVVATRYHWLFKSKQETAERNFTVQVDVDGPVLQVHDVQALTQGMVITGNATDANGIYTIAASGARTVPDAEGNFSLTIPWDRIGVSSLVSIRAIDAGGGAITSKTLEVVRPGNRAEWLNSCDSSDCNDLHGIRPHRPGTRT